MSKHHVIEFDENCKSCQGTGLYMGRAERDGAAVVCHICDGTGCHHVKIQYDNFDGRVGRWDVDRVFKTNPGMCLGKKFPGGSIKELSEFGGMPYSDWVCGLPFPAKSENRKYTCPAWWYQSADYAKKPIWSECPILGCFRDCKHFGE